MIIEKFVELTRKIKWNNIFQKTTLLSIVFIFIPIVITGSIIISHNTKTSKAQIENYQVNAHNQVQNAWFDMTTAIYETQSLIENETFNSAFVYSPFYAFDDQQAREINVLAELLKNSVLLSPNISSVYIYNSYNDYVISNISNSPRQHFVELSWYDKLEQYSNKNAFIRTTEINRERVEYLTLIKQFSPHEQCYAIYNINYPALKKSISADNNILEAYITDVDNTILFSLNAEDIGKNISSIASINSPSKDVRLITTTDSYGQICYSVSKGNIKVPFSNFSLLILILMILLLVSSTLSSYIITAGFSRSLVKIISAIPQDNSAVTHEDSNNEVGFIIKTISDLITKNNTFEEKLATQLSKLKKSQVMALQEQINPHFLFNSLNLINLLDLSEQKETHSISKVSFLLSDILRYILNTEEYLVPLDKEISYLEKYIELQRIKYENDFKIIWNIENTSKKLHIVKFSLQPIVENAIMHGFTEVDNCENIISISAKQTDNILEIRIYNNGIPIESNKLKELNHQIQNNTAVNSKHIGLLNVCLRYRLLFDQSFKGYIESDNKGTTVSLQFPAIDSYDI